MSNEKKQEEKKELPMRQIIIEFNEHSIKISKAEIASNWELESILKKLLKQLNI